MLNRRQLQWCVTNLPISGLVISLPHRGGANWFSTRASQLISKLTAKEWLSRNRLNSLFVLDNESYFTKFSPHFLRSLSHSSSSEMACGRGATMERGEGKKEFFFEWTLLVPVISNSYFYFTDLRENSEIRVFFFLRIHSFATEKLLKWTFVTVMAVELGQQFPWN